jgi:branched-subunit amino acid aminotransferase/4-amino-4-deoxychorismate lyase
MSILNRAQRPTVMFDVMNKDHRRWAQLFITNTSWKDVPVTFIVEDNAQVPGVIMRKMCEFYTAKEFGKIVVDTADVV